MQIKTFAMDIYDSTTNQLTISSVQVDNTIYTNVVVAVGSVIAIGQFNQNINDLYDTNTNQLKIQSVQVGADIIQGAIITVDKVISVGGSSPISSSELTAGVWTGRSTWGNTDTVDLIVLPNNNMYAIMAGAYKDGTLWGNGFNVGMVNVNGNTFNGSFIDFASINGFANITTSKITGSVNQKTNISGNVTFSNNSETTFSLSPLINFSYNLPASLSSVAGSWSGYYLNNYFKLNVTSNGKISGTSLANGSNIACNYVGSMYPNNSGVNVFDMTITYSGLPCSLSGQTLTGIAITYPLPSGSLQLVSALKNIDNTGATMFVTSR